MKLINIQKLTASGLFAALTCAATMVIRIPTPGTGGYIHPGDALVILCGIFLGPVYGGLSAGIGSALSDLAGGYILYVPATFFIKGITAVMVAFIYQKTRPFIRANSFRCAFCGVFSTILVVSGYLVFEYFIYDAGAFSGVIPNMIQGISGLVISFLLLPLLDKISYFKTL